MTQLVAVLVHTPAHSQLSGALTYRSAVPLAPGTLVRVPLGRRELLGVVWDTPPGDDAGAQGQPESSRLRDVAAVLGALGPLNGPWRALVTFAASYYQRAAGEVALAALPPQLRDLGEAQLQRRLKRRDKKDSTPSAAEETSDAGTPRELTAEQQQVLGELRRAGGTFLLFGATGSGKTEVYLRYVAEVLEGEPGSQAIVMVPEINLTPQLLARFQERFCGRYGADAVVPLHSGMTQPQRLASWMAAHLGQARIVLGTRMAVFASVPQLRLIVVDEEHDPSYKQQEGARYSARDLAVYRGRLENAKVILGSATPSLESWHLSRAPSAGGRYTRLLMPSRIGEQAQLPLVRRVDMNHQPKRAVIAPPLLAAIAQRIEAGEQCLVFLNRRGYAPVLQCSSCDWKSACPHCSAFRVFHKIDRSLRCHHCGFAEAVPRACPACGNLDIAPVGRGTERLEEHLAELLAGIQRPSGGPVRIARIDADNTRLRGSLQARLAEVHAGDVDVLVGTQMVAKGHDFRRITLVAAINADNALFSSDFRAPERLFCLLMQAAGRAGRDAAVSARSEMWIQSFQPRHPLFEALKQHDYPAFAAQQLEDRQNAGLPPFAFQALLRAEARSQAAAQAFLGAASAAATATLADVPGFDLVTLYPPVPMVMQRIANVERAQMLVESTSRVALQGFLAAWQGTLHATRQGEHGKGLIRWAVDVDPLAI